MSLESRNLRLDTDHCVQELMGKAVARVCREVDVRVRHNDVYLSGVTESWYEKQMAQESLRDVSAAYRIHNDIAVSVRG